VTARNRPIIATGWAGVASSWSSPRPPTRPRVRGGHELGQAVQVGQLQVGARPDVEQRGAGGAEGGQGGLGVPGGDPLADAGDHLLGVAATSSTVRRSRSWSSEGRNPAAANPPITSRQWEQSLATSLADALLGPEAARR
jgi:hypothetical protein